MTSSLGGIAGERGGHGLRDESLSTSGRAVEKHALRRLESVLAVQLRLLERQLDGVLDLFNLRAEAADILVGNVRNFFKQKMFDIRALDVFENEAVAQIREHGVADAQTVGVQAARDVKNTRLVRVYFDEDAARVNNEFDRHHRAGIFVSRNADDDELLVKPQLLSGPQRVDINAGRGGHVHLATANEGVNRMILVASGQESGKRRRGARKGIQLLAKIANTVAGGDEGGG